VVCYGCCVSVRVARGPDVSRQVADVPVLVSPGRLAKWTPCIAAGQLYLYLIYIVDKIACDSGTLACKFIACTYMHWRINLLIGIHKVVSDVLITMGHGNNIKAQQYSHHNMERAAGQGSGPTQNWKSSARASSEHRNSL
jgi:hypothetical protein